MRLHTTHDVNARTLFDAARAAGAELELTEHKSRTRDRAFDVHLTGASRRRPNRQWSGDDHAATWDQWGIFLAAVYAVDPGMTCHAYGSATEFHELTDYRFETLTLAQSHGDHTWGFAGVPREQSCARCGAVRRWTMPAARGIAVAS